MADQLPDGRVLFSGGRRVLAGTVEATAEPLVFYGEPAERYTGCDWLAAVRVSEDGRYVAMTGHVSGMDSEFGGKTRVLSVADGSEVASAVFERTCNAIAISAKARIVAGAGFPGSLAVFSWNTRGDDRQVRELGNPRWNRLIADGAIHPSDEYALRGLELVRDGTVVLCLCADELLMIPFDGKERPRSLRTGVTSIPCSRDGRWLAAATADSIEILDTRDWSTRQVLRVPRPLSTAILGRDVYATTPNGLLRFPSVMPADSNEDSKK